MRFLKYVVVLLVCLFPVSIAAQDKAATEEPANNMEIVRDALRAQKKLFVAENMQMSETEAKTFWPVYEEYQNQMKTVTDRSIKLIEHYADNYLAMTDEIADKMMDEYLAIEQDRVKLQKQYLPKFRKVLNAKQVARYYQLENKIQAVARFDLAAQIPLVD
jgi:hypothetical protein